MFPAPDFRSEAAGTPMLPAPDSRSPPTKTSKLPCPSTLPSQLTWPAAVIEIAVGSSLENSRTVTSEPGAEMSAPVAFALALAAELTRRSSSHHPLPGIRLADNRTHCP